MEKANLAKKGTYAGTGAGLIIFMLVGFFPGALIGGAVGLYLSNMIMGGAAGASIIPRIITALSMASGVMASAAIFVVGMSVVGWAAGTALEAIQGQSTELAEARQSAK